jgi:hypothetical protein
MVLGPVVQKTPIYFCQMSFRQQEEYKITWKSVNWLVQCTRKHFTNFYFSCKIYKN